MLLIDEARLKLRIYRRQALRPFIMHILCKSYRLFSLSIPLSTRNVELNVVLSTCEELGIGFVICARI